MTSFDDYQSAAVSTALYPSSGEGTFEGLCYLIPGLAAEAGEVAGKFAKAVRDDGLGYTLGFTDEREDQLVSELGDVLWFLAVIADELGYRLEDIADMNVEKLAARKAKGTIQGSGDKR